MKIALIILGVIILLVITALFIKSRIAPTNQASANDIPQVISQLERSQKTGNFAVFCFSSPEPTDGEPVNLQFSCENGVVGIDWVLISKTNIADSENVKSIAKEFGLIFQELESNNVRYLRATGPNIDKLGFEIITKLYKLQPNVKLEMITEGFEWQSPAA